MAGELTTLPVLSPLRLAHSLYLAVESLVSIELATLVKYRPSSFGTHYATTLWTTESNKGLNPYLAT